MSGGTLIVWLRVCNASIGVPAAMRPITGTATGRSPSSAGRLELARTLPRLPSMTLGVKPRRLPAAAWSSGSLMTSIARARLGRRRMKPRSSSAVIRRWMPDFERRSSASFISSKEGGTPLSFRRSLMNRRSSYCLRVNISTKVPRLMSSDSETLNSAICRYMLETNHERTLYVRYMFRNCLIYREQSKVGGTRIAGALRRGAATLRKPCRLRPSARTVRAREVLVLQRDSQAAKSPDDRREERRVCHRHAPQDARADSPRAGRWRRRRGRARRVHGDGESPN